MDGRQNMPIREERSGHSRFVAGRVGASAERWRSLPGAATAFLCSPFAKLMTGRIILSKAVAPFADETETWQ